MKIKFMSLRSRILTYTVIPTAVLLIVAAVLMMSFTRTVTEGIFKTGSAGNTELVCSRIEAVLQEYISSGERSSDSSSIEYFLKTVDDRDSAVDNAYYSYVLEQLDSTITKKNNFAENCWVASISKPDILVSNSSCGRTPDAGFDVTEMAFYKDMHQKGGSSFITDPYISMLTGKMVISVITYVKDSRSGANIGIFGIDMDLTSFDDKIYTFADDGNVKIFIRSGNGLIVYSNNNNQKFQQFANLHLSMQGNDGIISHYLCQDTEMVGSTTLVPNSGWTIFALQSTSDITDMINGYTTMTCIMFALILLILITMLVIVSSKISMPLQNYTRLINSIHLDNDDYASEENTVLLNPEGCRELEHFAIGFNSLIERNKEILSELHDMNVAAEKEKRIYQIALESSSDIVFEYDISSDALISYGSIWDKAASKTLQSETKRFISSFSNNDLFTFSDRESFHKFFTTASCDEPVQLAISVDDETHWYSCEGTPINDTDNNGEHAVKIVGKFRNIDDLVTLKNVAECDALTGFYNKITTQRTISKQLAKNKSTKGAGILIDIDNFKSLNDKMGHAAGDRALVETTERIRSIFGENDILGRIGGDEFFVFMPSFENMETLQAIIDRANALIKHTYTNNSTEVTISASIGIAISPEHGTTFEEIYASADIAMYLTKVNGKDGSTVYNGEKRPEYHGNR